MKKHIYLIFVLGLLLSCETSPYRSQYKFGSGFKLHKYEVTTSHLKRGHTKFFIGGSNISIKDATSKAINSCEDFAFQEKLNPLECFTRSSSEPNEFVWLWHGHKEVNQYEVNQIKREKIEKEKLHIAKLEKEKKAKQNKIASLELSYGKACISDTLKKGFDKASKEYEKCLFNKDQEAIAKQKALDEKLAKMTPVQRREFNCENAFKFKPGTNEFNQCVFKLYTTELELEKLELQKQVALANERAAKAQMQAAASEQARANAVAAAQIAAADAQKAAAKSQSLANSISLMQLGSSMLGNSSSSSSSGMNSMGRVRTTCRNVGGFLNCY